MIKIKKHDRRACCSAFLLFVFTGVLTLSVLVGALFGNPWRVWCAALAAILMWTAFIRRSTSMRWIFAWSTGWTRLWQTQSPRTACARRCRPMRGLC